jgi:predicted TIM-barrel fold metal-dependent hydrolase
MILDFHARLGSAPDAADRLVSTMDEWGIGVAVVAAGGVIDIDRLSRQVVEGGHITASAANDAVLQACAEVPNRLIPCYFANPHRDTSEYHMMAAAFAAVEISPAVHGVPLTDERTLAIVEIAAQHAHPVYIVCIGRSGCTVHDLVALSARYPSVTFVLGHCGFVGIDVHALTVIKDRPNILAEASGCYTGVARAAVQLLGADRVLFGTEQPFQHPSVELAKLRALNLNPASWRKITWDNAQRILSRHHLRRRAA